MYCETCIKGPLVLNSDVKIYKRKRKKGLPKWMDWVPLCEEHAIEFKLHENQGTVNIDAIMPNRFRSNVP